MTDPRQELLDECMPAIKRIARNWSQRNRIMDAEDLEQEALVKILTVLRDDDLSAVQSKRNYLVRAAYYAILRAVTERDPVIPVPRVLAEATGAHPPFVDSLDAALPGTDGVTRHDAIAVPVPVPCSLTDAQIQALHTAVGQLSPVRRQAVTRKFFGLATRGPDPVVIASNRNRGLRQLRANEQLRQAVCS